MSTTFYAYIYRDPSRNNEPIYVGKGCGRRAWEHLTFQKKHPFIQRLKFMKKADVNPDIEIINSIDENHAFFLEECLIQVLGRKDLGKGSLLNLTNGGEGSSGYEHTYSARLKIKKSKIGKVRKLMKCPHCSVLGGEGAIQRWHFDNCKVKI
jgi:hypothetical protein